MKKQWVMFGVVVLMIGLLASLLQADFTPSDGDLFSTVLSGANEVGNPGDPDADGTAQIALNSTTGQACIDLETSGLSTVTLAHIHEGAAGVNGPVRVDFANILEADGNFTGCVSTTQEQIDAIIANPAGFYVNIHTNDFPTGAVRGQLALVPEISNILEGSQEVGIPGDPDGSGNFALAFDSATDQVCLELTTANIGTVTLTHIHEGAFGANGPVRVDFASILEADGNFEGCVTSTQAQIDAILANPAGYYVNVHTQDIPSGALRGQLMLMSNTPTPTPTETETPSGTETPESTATPTETAVPAPGSFTLVLPPNGVVIRDTSTVTAITWTESSGATTYRFLLFQLSTNVRIGEILDLEGLTPADDEDPLDCAAGTCTLSVDASVQALLTDGFYSWTTVATGIGGDTEASNAPFFFTVNTQPVELIVNGGMEIDTTPADKIPDSWTGKGLTGDRIRCNTPTKTFAFEGECAFRFKGGAGENSKIRQDAVITSVGSADTLTLTIQINTTLPSAGKVVIVKIRYSDPSAGVNGDGKDKIEVELAAATTNYQQFTGSLVLDGAVTRIRTELRNRNTSGKILLDAVSLVAAPPSGAGVIALPQN